MPGSVRNVPTFIKAASAFALRRLMFRTNLKFGKEFRYFDISFDGTSWFAWYYLEISAEDLTNGSEEPAGL